MVNFIKKFGGKKRLTFVLFCGIISSLAFANGPENGKDELALNNNVSTTSTQDRKNFGASFVPGDAVSISTYPDTSFFLNGIFPVDDRGYVELPILGKTRITQMTQEQFQNFLLENYRDYLRFPNIQVKPMIRLSVLGGVLHPGLYYFDQDFSLWEVLHMVGGTLDEDGLKHMRWKRDRKTVEDDLIPYLQSGVALKNIRFRSGDQIWVRSPNKPGFLQRTRSYLSLITAATSFLTLYITYQRFVINQR